MKKFASNPNDDLLRLSARLRLRESRERQYALAFIHSERFGSSLRSSGISTSIGSCESAALSISRLQKPNLEPLQSSTCALHRDPHGFRLWMDVPLGHGKITVAG